MSHYWRRFPSNLALSTNLTPFPTLFPLLSSPKKSATASQPLLPSQSHNGHVHLYNSPCSGIIPIKISSKFGLHPFLLHTTTDLRITTWTLRRLMKTVVARLLGNRPISRPSGGLMRIKGPAIRVSFLLTYKPAGTVTITGPAFKTLWPSFHLTRSKMFPRKRTQLGTSTYYLPHLSRMTMRSRPSKTRSRRSESREPFPLCC